MNIIADQPDKPELPQATARAIADIRARIDSLDRIAAFLRRHPDLPSSAALYTTGVLVGLGGQEDPKAALSTWMLRAIEAGARVKPYKNTNAAGVELYFGTFPIRVYADPEQVSTTSEWRLDIEIPAHARLVEQPTGGA